MRNCMVVEFTLVSFRREDMALQKRRSVEDHGRLIGIARENHLIKSLFYVILVHSVG